ncbi:hypothetical protein [Paenibacillus sp. Leaf72]|uniref:hypothetical protein n=1 Tax=Paenibacillus sp. Leaf72 TaxID=1736234 RepID=UPI0006F4B24B|nr:hypothetical protein [Paenibacillus sp. Leaf72]KQO12389.1 hypothetical protein ASF12_30695 [Paenibacillus sp. Leaf72]
MFTGWRLSVLGLIIVGTTAIVAPLFKLMEFGKTIPLFILFALFIGCMELLEWNKRRNRRR